MGLEKIKGKEFQIPLGKKISRRIESQRKAELIRFGTFALMHVGISYFKAVKLASSLHKIYSKSKKNGTN